MNDLNMQPSAANPVPTLSLVGSPFNFIEAGEPDLERTEHVPLWTAVRPGEVWKIWWNGKKSELELRFNESTLWSSLVHPLQGRLRELPAYRQIVDQFTGPAQAGAAGSSILGLACKRLAERVRTPRAIGRTALTLVRWFLMFMGLVLLVTMCSQWRARSSGGLPPGSHYGVAAPKSEPVAQRNEVPPELRDRTLGDTLSATEMQVVANATRELGIQMRPSGQPFVIFSDPNCPSCKDLEPKLSQIDPRFVPVIVPVSFKVGSEELVKNVLCAKDTVSAWSAAIGGYAPTGEAVSDGKCAGAEDKATKANGAFVALNLTGTPTLVSATGKVIAGSGSLDDINKWLAENGGLKDGAAR
jgi:protein-disulfide isomerase